MEEMCCRHKHRDADEYNALLTKSNAKYAQLADRLYMKSFPNVQFYNPNRKGLSLLHLIFENIPEWRIGNVDQSLWHRERKFSEDRVAIYDFLTNTVAETFGCTFVWDSLNGVVHCYEEVDDDEIKNEASTRWETDVYISKDNLASETKVSYSSDNIKTKLVVTGSDGLDIREANLGRNEIMDLSFYHSEDWMEQDLFERYADYVEEVNEAQTGLTADGFKSSKYPISYPDAVQGWVSANNRYHEIMHAIPSESNVVRVGDEFKKLFCVYTPIDTAYTHESVLHDITSSTKFIDGPLYYDEQLTVPILHIQDGEMFVVAGFKLQYIEPDNKFQVMENLKTSSLNYLVKKLNQYHVDEDVDGSKNDNILLKLKNSSSDVATIRIYDDHEMIADQYNSYYNYYSKDDEGNFAKLDIADYNEFIIQKGIFQGNLYTNNYKIQSIVVHASSGVSEAPQNYSLVAWLSGDLPAETMNLSQYNVTYIGTMGAYFVLAKDEVVVDDDGILQISYDYLHTCGVNLLKEKHQVYTSIFQTQTEAMYSHEKYQCIVQDEPPKGIYKDKTRWLDTDDGLGTLHEYDYATNKWVPLTGANSIISSSDKSNFENYQRYVDNYIKLQAAQGELVDKERKATYCLNGYIVPDRKIDFSLYTPGDDGVLRYNGQELEVTMHRAAQSHFDELTKTTGVKYTVTRYGFDPLFPLYTFTTSFDPISYKSNTESYSSIKQYYIRDRSTNTYTPIDIESQEMFQAYDGSSLDKILYVQDGGNIFAVYLDGTTPRVAYKHSQGVYQMIMEYIRTRTEMSEFFSEDQWIRLSPFIKEDEFNDSNFLLTGYESEEERISICKELMESAEKELKTLCKPSLEFSMTMANILALPEFEPLVEQFQHGNFIRVEIREDYVKRTRLLEVNLNFDDLSDFNCTFGNLVTTKSEIDRHAELLSQAVTAGKQVAKSGNIWQKTAEKTNKLETDIANGLKDSALAIGNASGQAISWDSTGMHFRKYKEGSTTEFVPEEIAIINNSLVATNDSWLTSKAAFGKYFINGEERWGPIAEYVTADTIEGKFISGGSLRIGGKEGDKGTFIVNEDGSVQILGPNNEEMYAGKALENSYRFQTRLTYSGLTIFTDINHECTITCDVYDTNKPIGENGIKDQEITSEIIANGGKFTWNRSLSGSNTSWTPTLVNGQPNVILIKHTDIERNAQFDCVVDFDETKFNA